MLKRTILLVILISYSLLLFAQDGVDDAGFEKRNVKYTRFGFTMPTWNLYGANGKTDFPDGAKRFGFNMEAGRQIPFRFIPFEKVWIGVEYNTLSLSFFDIRSQLVDTLAVFRNEVMFNVSTKAGPYVSWIINNDLAIDLFCKYDLKWFVLSVTIDVENFEPVDENESLFLYTGALKNKLSIGLNVKYKSIILGCEFNFGSVLLRDFIEDDGTYRGNLKDNTLQTPLPMFQITLGTYVFKDKRF